MMTSDAVTLVVLVVVELTSIAMLEHFERIPPTEISKQELLLSRAVFAMLTLVCSCALLYLAFTR